MGFGFARIVSISSGLSLALACGFDTGGVGDSTSESGDESGGPGPGSGATLDPSVTASATSATSASTSTDATGDGSGSTGEGSSGADSGTTGRSETSSADTSGDATTTGDPTLETSSDSGQDEPLYGPCEDVEDCNPGAQCHDFTNGRGVIATVCYESCDMVACPEPPGGSAAPICVDGLMACGLDCASGMCPAGMECYSLTNIGSRCGWPV